MAVTSSAIAGAHQHLEAQIRWRTLEIAFWLATLLPFVVTPDYLVLASQIAITALFALSLDLILGYAGTPEEDMPAAVATLRSVASARRSKS